MFNYNEIELRPHSGVKPRNVYINLNSAASSHHPIIPDQNKIECEIGDY